MTSSTSSIHTQNRSRRARDSRGHPPDTAFVHWHGVTRALVAGCGLLVASAAASEGAAVGVRIVRIDGTTVTGTWQGSSSGGEILVHSADEALSLPLDEIDTIAFDTPRKPPPGPIVFHLFDGGHLYGELVGDSAAGDGSPTGVPSEGRDGRHEGVDSTSSRIVTRTVLGDVVGLTFEQLAGIRLGDEQEYLRAGELFRDSLASRLPGQDVLITRSVDDPRVLRGRLESFNATGGTFHFGQRPREFRTEKVFGIVFAAGVVSVDPRQSPVTVTLCDGGHLRGRVLGMDACVPRQFNHAVCISTNLGRNVELSVTDIGRIDVRSDRVVYVSDLAPVEQHVEGLLHQRVAGRSPWPVRLDRSVVTGPLAMEGRRFDKGLGVHSRTELVYAIGGGYEKFVATIGVDDAVRPRGSVVFRVLGSGETGQQSSVLFDSGTLTGTDAPQDIIVDLSKVTTVTLLVDYGEDLDVADAAVWGNARFLKAKNAMGENAP